MDHDIASNQLAQVQQQSQQVMQSLQTVAQKIAAAAPDPTTGREWAMDLKEVALAIQTQNQAVTMMLSQMAQYISNLEQQLQTHPSPTLQPRGWASSGMQGGGFLSNITAGLGLGAGFAVAGDVVNDLFNMF